MAFKSAAARGAFFEKLKQKGSLGTPGIGTNPASKINTLPELKPISKMQGIPKMPGMSPMKPMNSFEKLKNKIKMPKVGY